MTILQPISRVYHSQSTIKDSKNHFRKSQNVRQRLVEGVHIGRGREAHFWPGPGPGVKPNFYSKYYTKTVTKIMSFPFLIMCIF